MRGILVFLGVRWLDVKVACLEKADKIVEGEM